jgi:HAD superfamily hydrolase (TIGR01549 family)
VAETKIVFWDVYGTLIVAPRGDLESLLRRQDELSKAFSETARKFSSPATLEQFLATIRAHREQKRVAHPEIRIEVVWRELVPAAHAREAALDFERRANPKRAQPEAAETLLELQRRGYRQGVISNAQFYTRIELAELLPAVFDPELVFLSCDLGVAKPDLTAFRMARAKVQPAQCVMVGDSLENDIEPARQVGFTALHFGSDIQRLSQVLERL